MKRNETENNRPTKAPRYAALAAALLAAALAGCATTSSIGDDHLANYEMPIDGGTGA
jgi:hypothetical protein